MFYKVYLVAALLISALNAWGGPYEDLQGSWLRGCVNGSEIKIIVKDQSITRTRFLWSDSRCLRRAQTWHEIGAFEVSDQYPATISIRWHFLNVSPYRIALAEEFNQIGACGLRDWVAGDSRNHLKGCLGSPEIHENNSFSIQNRTLSFEFFGVDVFSGEAWKPSESPFMLEKI